MQVDDDDDADDEQLLWPFWWWWKRAIIVSVKGYGILDVAAELVVVWLKPYTVNLGSVYIVTIKGLHSELWQRVNHKFINNWGIIS